MKQKKKGKKVLGRKPERVIHVKEVMYVESYPGGPKKPIEMYYAVDDFTN